MNNNLVESNTVLMDDIAMKNASALLALLHGKTDSICRVFKKEIIVGKNELKQLNEMMITKLSLHTVKGITTSVDITFANKRILTFKTWDEFEKYDFIKENSITKSIFIQWDFFAEFNGYKVPQRHTVNVRISDTPNPSDFFKVLLSGGFDEAHDMDIQSSTMICKVDFINNALAEELVNVAGKWNDLCECSYTTKGKLSKILFSRRNECAHIFEICLIMCVISVVAIIIKIGLIKDLFIITKEMILYMILFAVPLSEAVKDIGHAGGKKIYNKFADLMDCHVFKISEGDRKENERIEKDSKITKELIMFIINALFSIVLSLIFFIIE